MTASEIFSGLAVLVSLYAIFSQRRFVASQTEAQKANAKATLSKVDSDNIKDALELKKQYKDEMNELRASLESEEKARNIVEEQLRAARATIAELQDRDAKREATMSDLKSQFDRDSLLRANVEKALVLANEKISSLEMSNRSMADRISSLENERRTWRSGIAKLIDQVTKHDEEPAWRPPDTQPLIGKVTIKDEEQTGPLSSGSTAS